MKLTPKQQRIALPILFVVGLLFGALIMWGALEARKPKPKPPLQITAPTTDTQQVTLPPAVTEVPTTTVEQGSYDGGMANPFKDYVFSPDTVSTTLDIAWTKPVRRFSSDVLSPVIGRLFAYQPEKRQELERKLAAADELDKKFLASKKDNLTDPFGTWEIGKVKTGKYTDSTLYLRADGNCEMGSCVWYKFLISPDGQQVRLMNAFYDQNASVLPWSEIAVPAFDVKTPTRRGETVLGPDGRKLVPKPYGFFQPNVEWLDLGKVVTYTQIGKTQDGRVLYGSGSCVFLLDNDGVEIFYGSFMPSSRVEAATGYPTGLVTMNDGTVSEFLTKGGGCDGFCPRIDYSTNTQDIVQIGKAGTDPIFAPRNSVTSAAVKQAYDEWYTGDEKKPTFEEFQKKYPSPVVYWKDAFGRWVEYEAATVIPMAECGKPVIYLYPEKTTNVSVKLPSFINVTVSEPSYPTNGWNVVANPNGNLVLNGKTYDSLYWEGTGVGYVTPKEGFVIKDGEQDAQLANLLKAYGLNEKESADFRTFWLPKMQGAPYYRVSFLTSEWLKAAPLSVSPRPQSVIRIFMDWQKLSVPMNLPEPKIATPKRDGFTLVEWGGLLY